jgi:hypothetical protein
LQSCGRFSRRAGNGIATHRAVSRIQIEFAAGPQQTPAAARDDCKYHIVIAVGKQFARADRADISLGTESDRNTWKSISRHVAAKYIARIHRRQIQPGHAFSKDLAPHSQPIPVRQGRSRKSRELHARVAPIRHIDSNYIDAPTRLSPNVSASTSANAGDAFVEINRVVNR